MQKSIYIVLKTWKMANEMKPDEWLSRYNNQNNSIFFKNKIVSFCIFAVFVFLAYDIYMTRNKLLLVNH